MEKNTVYEVIAKARRTFRACRAANSDQRCFVVDLGEEVVVVEGDEEEEEEEEEEVVVVEDEEEEEEDEEDEEEEEEEMTVEAAKRSMMRATNKWMGRAKEMS